jgi:glycerol-3-phosphate dehydrogenase (NAD(P)+)
MRATLDLDDALSEAQALFMVVPSQAVRPVIEQVVKSPRLAAGIPIINMAKGFEVATLQRLSEVIASELVAAGPDRDHPVAVLLGPSHAEEVALELPTALVLSGQPGHDWTHWQNWISGPFFRVYTNDDMAGVEIASGFKNIIALAVGMADGLGTGDNTRGTLMTRGMIELARIGCALGGQLETFFGLAGIGDMITTCISRHSRNRNFGEAVTRGQQDPQEILAGSVQVVEGVYMAQAALKLGEKLGIELPITKQVHDVLFSGKVPRQAMRELMERQLRPELD